MAIASSAGLITTAIGVAGAPIAFTLGEGVRLFLGRRAPQPEAMQRARVPRPGGFATHYCHPARLDFHDSEG
jgi:hypothetical protein